MFPKSLLSCFLSALAIGMVVLACIKASSIWDSWFQSSFFGVRISNTYAYSNRFNPYRQHECVKSQACQQWVREIEHASFSSLAFATSAIQLYISVWPFKWIAPYCRVMSCLRCHLGFSYCTLPSFSGCHLRGHVPAFIDLALEEGLFGAPFISFH